MSPTRAHSEESLEAACGRVLSTKARLERVYLEQLYTFGAPDRDPRDRVISVAYYAILAVDQRYSGPGQWHTAEALPKLGFDHAEILSTALTRLRAKLARHCDKVRG